MLQSSLSFLDEPPSLLSHKLVAAGLLLPSRVVLRSAGENMETSPFG